MTDLMKLLNYKNCKYCHIWTKISEEELCPKKNACRLCNSPTIAGVFDGRRLCQVCISYQNKIKEEIENG